MMAYVNNFVVSLIVNGKPQREFSSNNQRTVTVPFGSEYKIRVKNQSHKRALVNVSIDGASIFSGGQQLILNGQQSVDLERFVDELDKGRKFKFVSKEQAAKEDHFDPTSSEMGLLKVEFVNELEYHGLLGIGQTSWGTTAQPLIGGGFLRGVTSPQIYTNNINYCSAAVDSVPNSSTAVQANNSQASGVTASNAVIGGTVEGGNSSQQFGKSKDHVMWDYSNKTVIDIKMKGPSNEVVNDFGLIGLASSIKKKGSGNQEFKVHSVMTTTDGSITVVYR